ncbi:MAG: HAD hydrolase-like protein [Eubacteriales bacterium]|nr:HAD hydrolase-like protein [Eubacteriales bacterium]
MTSQRLNSEALSYRTYIFDLDGTLVDSLFALHRSVNLMRSELGLEAISLDHCRRYVGNGAVKLVERAIAKDLDRLLERGLGNEARIHDLAYASYMRHFSEHATDGLRPYPGLISVLDELLSRGCTLACLSNKPDPLVHESLLAAFGEAAQRYFQIQRGARSDSPLKPDPTALLELLEALNSPHNAAVLVGDSEVDIETARNVGIDSIACTWGFRSQEELEQCAPIHLIHSAEEILTCAPN